MKDVLSERGTVTTDERTNVLIVKDIQEALVRAEGLVRNLDTETPQVLIESRIVEATSNFTQALGVQWGGNAALHARPPATRPASPSRTTSPAPAAPRGGAHQRHARTRRTTRSTSPPPSAQGSGGGIGLIFGSAGGAFNLNLRLSALENTGVVKTISAPEGRHPRQQGGDHRPGHVHPLLARRPPPA